MNYEASGGSPRVAPGGCSVAVCGRDKRLTAATLVIDMMAQSRIRLHEREPNTLLSAVLILKFVEFLPNEFHHEQSTDNPDDPQEIG